MLLNTGVGVAKDRPRAKALIRKACDGGEAIACDLYNRWYRAD
jgi:TPR repeat protein